MKTQSHPIFKFRPKATGQTNSGLSRVEFLIVVAWTLASFLQPTVLVADGTPSSQPSKVIVHLPGKPFGVAASHDGNWVFVSTSGKPAIAVLQNENGEYKVRRAIPVPGAPTGVALTHDGKLLAVAAGGSVDLLLTSRMMTGEGNPLKATFNDGPQAHSIYVNVTTDDRLLFVSEEGTHVITVIDLNRVRTTGYSARAVIGRIPVGLEPIALTFSPDGQWLYTTSEVALPAWGWPRTMKPEHPNPKRPDAMVPQGAVIVVDVAKARVDPAHSVIARVPAGGNPVRMAISPDGKRIYVTARQ